MHKAHRPGLPRPDTKSKRKGAEAATLKLSMTVSGNQLMRAGREERLFPVMGDPLGPEG